MAKILVVDDAAFMRMRCARLLTENGYEVVEAGDGVEALQRFGEHRPDAVLMDITMPNMDGLMALKKLMEMDNGARVAMVSAMGQQSLVIEALKAGAKDFVVKPFDPTRVLSAVKKLMA